MTAAPRFQPEETLRVLEEHGVRFVLIGGLAATLHGSTLRTGDADICPARDPANLGRLASALVDLDARLRASDAPNGVRSARDAEFLSRVELCNLTTRFGDLDLAFRPAGTDGYDDLRRRAVTYDLDGVRVDVAALDDVIRSKRASKRAKDRGALPELEALLEEVQTARARRKTHLEKERPRRKR